MPKGFRRTSTSRAVDTQAPSSAAIPVLLIWIYACWFIVILGVEFQVSLQEFWEIETAKVKAKGGQTAAEWIEAHSADAEESGEDSEPGEDSGDYERALFYRVRSFGMFEEMPASEKRDDYITAISAMLLRLYMKMDDEVHAKAEAEHLEELLKKYEKTTNGFEVYVNQLLFAQKYGKGQGEQELKKKTLDAFLQCENLIEYFDECAGFMRYLKLASGFNEPH